MMDFSFDSMQALEAVVRTGSFSAAAKELKKAQSGVSYAIRQLETRLGVKVFDRSGHRAQLTEVGKRILVEARDILESARRIQTLAQGINEGWEMRLELVIDGALSIAPIMATLKRLADEEIPTTIRVKVEFLNGVQYRFESERADMMLVKSFTKKPNYLARPLPEVTSILVARKDHPLAKLNHVDRTDLHRYVELSVHDTSKSDEFNDETMFGGDRVYYLSDFNTKRQALLAGLGFGWLPSQLADEELTKGNLVELAYETPRYTFTPFLVHRSDEPLGLAGQRFIELLENL